MVSAARPSTFGGLLKQHRVDAGLTQAGLGELANLSIRGISDLERGINKTARPHTVRALADALGLSGAERTTFERAARRGRSSHGLWPRPGPAAHDYQQQYLQHLLPIVGRARELACIDRWLDGITPPVLMFAGEPGIGKSRLLTEAAARAAEAGLHVMAAGCTGRGAQHPYAPLLSALDHCIATLAPARCRAYLRDCAWLTRLLPELSVTHGITPPTSTLPADHERRLVFAAVARFLAVVAADADSQGVALILDDLQWAPPDALDLLEHLIRACAHAHGSVRVLAAYRDTEVRPGDPVFTLLTELARDGLLTREALGPLDVSASADLLRLLLPAATTQACDAPDAPDAPDGSADDTAAAPARGVTPGALAARVEARIIERAGGIPLFLIGCAQSLRNSPDRSVDALPWDVAAHVRQRLARLSAPAVEALGVAAMIGRTVALDLLTAAAAQADETLAASLHEATCERLLVEVNDEAYAFAHDLIREVIMADLGAARRALLHRRIARALEASGGGDPPIEQLAYHYLRGRDTARAADYLEQAGDRSTALAAAADACRYYHDAVAQLERLGNTVRAAAVREKLGLALTTCARFDDAFQVLDTAATTYRALDDVEGIARVATQIGWAAVHVSTPEVGLDLIQHVLDSPGNATLTPTTLVGLLSAQAFLCFVNGRYHEQLAIDERIVVLAGAFGAPALVAQAQAHRSLALTMLGRFEEARRTIEDVLPELEESGDSTSLVMGLNCLTSAYAARGEFALAERYLDKQLAVCQRVGDPVALAFVEAGCADLNFTTGRWAAAREALARAAALIAHVGPCWASPYVRIYQGQLALATGETVEGERLLLAAIDETARSGDLQVRCLAACGLASFALATGQYERARSYLQPFADQLEDQVEALGTFGPTVLYLLAWAALDMDDLQRSERLIDQAMSMCRERNDRLVLVDALVVRTRLAVRRSEPDALSRLADAVTQARAITYPYGLARALYISALVHEQHGDDTRARADYAAALDILHALGERVYAHRIEHALDTRFR